MIASCTDPAIVRAQLVSVLPHKPFARYANASFSWFLPFAFTEPSDKLLDSSHRDDKDLKDDQVGQVDVLEDKGSTQCHGQGGIGRT